MPRLTPDGSTKKKGKEAGKRGGQKIKETRKPQKTKETEEKDRRRKKKKKIRNTQIQEPLRSKRSWITTSNRRVGMMKKNMMHDMTTRYEIDMFEK